jgi:hypothetical protein
MQESVADWRRKAGELRHHLEEVDRALAETDHQVRWETVPNGFSVEAAQVYRAQLFAAKAALVQGLAAIAQLLGLAGTGAAVLGLAEVESGVELP